MKNRRKTISTEDKLEVISRLGKGDRIVDICRVVRFAHSSARKILIMPIELNKVLSQEPKCLCRKTASSIGKEPYQKLRM